MMVIIYYIKIKICEIIDPTYDNIFFNNQWNYDCTNMNCGRMIEISLFLIISFGFKFFNTKKIYILGEPSLQSDPTIYKFKLIGLLYEYQITSENCDCTVKNFPISVIKSGKYSTKSIC